MYNLTDKKAVVAMESNAIMSRSDSGGFNDNWQYVESNADTSRKLVPIRKRPQSVLQAHQRAFIDNEVDMVNIEAKAACGDTKPAPAGGVKFANWYETKGRFIDSSEFDDLFVR